MGDMITISVEEYEALQAAREDLDDLRAYDRAKAALAAGEDELVPAAVVGKLLSGDNPIKVWREFRDMTQTRLAAYSGVNRVQIADIEAGRAKGSVETLKKLAQALRVSLDDVA